MTLDSSTTVPQELPDGLLGIVEFLDPPYRELVYGGDWFWFDGRWYASDTMWGGWVERPHENAIRGKGLPDDEWMRVHERMMNDRNWPD